MQEPNEEKDEVLSKAIRQAIAPETLQTPASRFRGQQRPGAQTQEQILAAISQTPTHSSSQPRPAATPATPVAPTPSTPVMPPTPQQPPRPGSRVIPNAPAFTSDLLRAALSAAGANLEHSDIDLTSVLKSEAVIPLVQNMLNDADVRERLFPHLPASQTGHQDIEELIRSPQFTQTLKLLTGALRHGQASTVLASMGLSAANAGPEGGVQALLRAIQSEADGKLSMDVDKKQSGDDDDLYGTEDKSKNPAPKNDDDDDMDLYGQ